MPRRRSPGLAAQMLLLAGLSAVGTVGARFVYERPLPLDYAWSDHVRLRAGELGLRVVEADEAAEITARFSHTVLDARRHEDYLAGHLPGAMSLPADAFDEYFDMVAPMLMPDIPIMVYCSGLECDESIKLGETLINAGFTNTVLFAGGITAWTNAGHEVVR